MAIEARADGPRGLLLRLARDGARAAAPEPPTTSDPFDDALSVGSPDAHQRVLGRLGWYVGIAPVILRLVLLPAGTAVLVSIFGAEQLLALICVVAALAVADGFALRRAAQLKRLEPRHVALSLVLSIIANLAVAVDVTGRLYPWAAAVTGTHLLATVLLWTLVWGGTAGLAAVGANVPLQITMLHLNRVNGGTGMHHPVAYIAGGTGVLILVVAAAILALSVLGFGTRLAMTVGMRAGREAERALLLRRMHDTVLQTLEAMALHPVGGPDDAEKALRRLRYMARGQAMQIRRVLGEIDCSDAAPRQLADELAALADEVAIEGLHVQLALGHVHDAALSPACRGALRDAAAEALRNAVKHSGAEEATLRLDETDGGVTVVVRDHGAGFDELRTVGGFGIRQSIHARLAEAGGRADIWSRCGRGTRVTLWVPLSQPQQKCS